MWHSRMHSGKRNRQIAALALAVTLALAVLLTPAPWTDAADHGDAPAVAGDRSADLNDAYLFLDPNDNTRVVMALTAHGFITPPEAVNFGVFDPSIRYRFELEINGDAIPDKFIDVTFSPKNLAPTQAQTATITLPNGQTFTALSTVPNLSPTPPDPVITTHAATGIDFFAGVTDDPFFFDIPGFARFTASVRAGSPDLTHLQRARDSFAGYNTLAVALRVPVAFIGLQPTPTNPGGNVLGLNTRAQRRLGSGPLRTGRIPARNLFADLDRAGVPAVNVALIPFSRKDEFNLASTVDDARGRFSADIVATLKGLGTSDSNINILAQIAVTRGDFLRLNVSTVNSGPGGGNNPNAGFPNGRRLSDDVIDTILLVVTNLTLTTGDSVNGNEVPFRNTFPFFAPPHQPFAPGTLDDRTRN
jgi:hypothetical protein